MEERSAGAVLFRENDKRFYLLLHYQANHWDFPKGNIEEGEREVDTVRREVREESSIDDIELIDGFRMISEYYYKRSNKIIHKQVVFYLAKTKQTEVKLSHEHTDYAWLTYKEALDRLTFVNSKKILQEAEEFLKNY